MNCCGLEGIPTFAADADNQYKTGISMATINIYGSGYQSPGDGGDIESIMEISDEELEEIKSIAADLDKNLDELDYDDLPSEIRDRMEQTLDSEWGYVDGESWNTMVNGFSISG